MYYSIKKYSYNETLKIMYRTLSIGYFLEIFFLDYLCIKKYW